MSLPGRTSTRAVRARRALVLAAVSTLLVNAWIGARLDPLLQETTAAELFELERRVERFPDRAGVRVLVFGNSHALAGLRPPDVAAALDLPPDAVFSLALLDESALEMRLLARRFGPAFPGVRLALANFDGTVAATGGHYSVRRAALTRGDWAGRWQLATAYEPSTVRRVGAVLSAPLPLVDFGPSLRESLVARPGVFGRRLVSDAARELPGYKETKIMHADYRWGYPLPWSVPGYQDLASYARISRTPRECRRRAHELVDGVAGQTAAAIADMTAWADDMAARGARVAFVDVPVAPRLRRQMLAVDGGALARFERARDPALAATGHPLVAVGADFAEADFYDLDHLTPAAAMRVARGLARGSAVRLAVGPR